MMHISRHLLVQFIQFAIVGGVGVGINESALIILTEHAHLWYAISNIFAIALASIWNFALYRIWVFRSSGTKT
jgi:putative flippase GtrA